MRNDAPAILLLLSLQTTSSSAIARSLARPARLSTIKSTIGSSIGLGLLVLVAPLLASTSLGVQGAAAQTLLTSDCPDGRSVCQVDSRPSKGVASGADRVGIEDGATAGPVEASDAMPLVLTNSDLGSTRTALLEREAAEREVRLQRERERARVIERRQAIESETAREGGGNTLIPGRGARGGGGADEVWVSMPRDGDRVAVGAAEVRGASGGSDSEASAGSEPSAGSESAPSSEEAQRGLADCMERSIRAGNGFVESRRVCEALFPSP